MQPTWLEILQKLLAGFLIRRILEVGGGIVLTWGVTSDEIGIMVIGFVSVIVGVAWSWVQTNWLAKATPSDIIK